MVRDTILYDRLGLKPGCSDSELKKAYFKLSKKWHPDKNKSKEATTKFQEIAEAYNILQDADKKNMYHQVGIDILNQGGGNGGMGGVNPNDIFKNFFGGDMRGFNFGGNSRRQENEIDKDIHQKLYVSLEDLYNGTKIDVKYQKKVFCKECAGTGSEDKKQHKCQVCDGKGKTIKIIRMGPMIQQAVQPCNKCNGTGKSCPNNKKCNKCSGKSYIVKTEHMQIPLQQGLSGGIQMQVEGKGNIGKNSKSNLILHIEEKQHMLFKRKDNHLVLEMEITLAESIVGFEKYIKFLDGKNKKIKFSDGLSIGDGDVKMIKGLGMKDRSGKSGNLIIKFSVRPVKINNLSDKTKIKIASLLNHEIKKLTGNSFKVEEYVQEQSRSHHHQQTNGAGECAQQ
tara:strand:+ start:261 stop:1445 length:1185 start_codon:yes stop_codon:yes gene_type:complete